VQRLASVLSTIVLVLGMEALMDGVSAAQKDDWARAPAVVATANAWREGEPIPAELRRYQKSLGDMPDPDDSDVLISGVTNLTLLAALATDVDADRECREDAFVQGTYVGGPSKFFAVLARDLSALKESNDPWLVELRRLVAQPHVAVNALFIEDTDMPRETALKVLDSIAHELRGGTGWDTVYRKYADEYGYRTSNLTKIGLLGHLVVYPDPALGRGYWVDIGHHAITWKGEELPRKLSRLAFFDAAHLPALMHSSPGDVIWLHSSLYGEFVLYQVEEFYPGASVRSPEQLPESTATTL
jgi:hypothetical protein